MIISPDILRKEAVGILRAVEDELDKEPQSQETKAALLVAKAQALHTLVLLQSGKER